MQKINTYLCGLYAIEIEQKTQKVALESALLKLNEQFPNRSLDLGQAVLILDREGFLKKYLGKNEKIKEAFCRDYVLSNGDFYEMLRLQEVSEEKLIRRCLRYGAIPGNFPGKIPQRKYSNGFLDESSNSNGNPRGGKVYSGKKTRGP